MVEHIVLLGEASASGECCCHGLVWSVDEVLGFKQCLVLGMA